MILGFLLSRAALPAYSRTSAARYSMTVARYTEAPAPTVSAQLPFLKKQWIRPTGNWSPTLDDWVVCHVQTYFCSICSVSQTNNICSLNYSHVLSFIPVCRSARTNDVLSLPPTLTSLSTSGCCRPDNSVTPLLTIQRFCLFIFSTFPCFIFLKHFLASFQNILAC